MRLASPARLVFSKISAFRWLPECLALLAVILYVVQSIIFAHTQWSVIDEGNYAYKGWLFVTGQYLPYQDYGPWTNHMPFSFLIFGAVQFLFGPGLRTIRYFMVFLGCMLLLGLWLTSRRLAGRWAAAACLWFVALNPFPISDYSVGIAEGLVACILTWVLYFVLGEGRSRRELVAGALLTAMLVLTRENMVLTLPFLFFYGFWQHGKKAGFLFMGITLFAILAVHACFWPGIIRIWVTWMPKNIRPLFGELVYQGVGRLDQPSKVPLLKNLFVFLNSVQANFLPVFGALAVWLGWPKGGFKDKAQFKLVTTLSALFIVLYLAHGWASLTKEYCPFCLINYVTFFSPVGLLLFFAFLPGIQARKPILPIWLIGAVIFTLMIGLGYSNTERYGNVLASIQIPRSVEFPIQTTEIWRILNNKFSMDTQSTRKILPLIAGALIGLLIVGAGLLIAKKYNKQGILSSAVHSVLAVTLLAGMIFSPTMTLGGVTGTCPQDILSSYEQIGAQLAQQIPAGTQIYWRGDPSPIPLLYIHNIKIYPPQLNVYFSYRPEKDADQVLRFGFWNGKLDQQWRKKADILLIRESELPVMSATLSSKQLVEQTKTAPVFRCDSASSIHLFQRKP